MNGNYIDHNNKVDVDTTSPIDFMLGDERMLLIFPRDYEALSKIIDVYIKNTGDLVTPAMVLATSLQSRMLQDNDIV